jgi:crotonobetainyl-CoA:carnitine CoA-transferase CaiB-like acyl-CoA transferase
MARMSGDESTDPAWPLAGLRVIDVTAQIAGPYAAKLLVDAGAEVVKVEPPGGDPMRRWTASGAELAPDQDGALFQFLNASKRSIVADPSTAEGRDLVLGLAADAALVLHDWTDDRAEEIGLGADALRAVNPGLCVVSITPWGASGPYAERPATEFTLQAATGSVAYRGLRDRRPVSVGGRFGEWLSGVYAAVGGVSAWLSSRISGQGQHVDVSIFEAMLLSMTVYHDLNGQWVEGDLARSVEIPSIEPAKDGWVGICTITGQQWKDFCALIGRPDIADDDSYLDGRRRMEHMPFMQEIIHGWTRERTVDEIVEIASLMRLPVAPVGDGRTLPQMDHLVERGVFSKSAGGFTQPRVPYLLEKTPTRPLGVAPGLDEHGDAIRASLAERSPAPGAPCEAAVTGAPALPLEGLRVVDLTAFWAGPFATCFLADLGADVVKVESIQRPDGMRFAGAIPNERLWEWSAVFAGANPGKRDVTLQLDSERGMALLKRLIAEADVVIENYSVRVVENFGLGWEDVRALSDRVIMVRMPAFGLDGPWRDRTGFAMTIEQVSGLAWITGYEDLPLVVRGACDPVGGMQTVFALLMALEHRRRTGEGQLVEVPLLENALNLAAEQVIEYSAYGELLTRNENRGPVSAPQGVYRCAPADGNPEQYVAVAVPDDATWQRLRYVMGDPTWTRAADLDHAAGRRARHDEIDEHLDAWLADQTREAAAERLVAAGVPASALVNAHRVMPHPQLEARSFFQTMVHPETGETRYPGFPIRFQGFGPGLHRSPPPTLGQHNQDILCGELGLSEDELAELRELQVVGERPSFM